MAKGRNKPKRETKKPKTRRRRTAKSVSRGFGDAIRRLGKA